MIETGPGGDWTQTVLQTRRLILRPLAATDAQTLLAIFSDSEVMRYWNTPPWSALDDARTFIADSHAAMRRRESLVLGVQRQSDARLLGKCMLFNFADESRRAEIGFGLGRPFWSQGYVGEAARALLAHAFDTLRLRRVEAEIDPANTASARALQRLGFVGEGLLRQRWQIGGVVSDSALYGLLASDLGPDRRTQP